MRYHLVRKVTIIIALKNSTVFTLPSKRCKKLLLPDILPNEDNSIIYPTSPAAAYLVQQIYEKIIGNCCLGQDYSLYVQTAALFTFCCDRQLFNFLIYFGSKRTYAQHRKTGNYYYDYSPYDKFIHSRMQFILSYLQRTLYMMSKNLNGLKNLLILTLFDKQLSIYIFIYCRQLLNPIKVPLTVFRFR